MRGALTGVLTQPVAKYWHKMMALLFRKQKRSPGGGIN